MVNFDINAFGDTILFSHPQGGENEALRRSVLIACAEASTVCLPSAPFPSSDDRSFGQARIPKRAPGLAAAECGAQSGLTQGFIPPAMILIHSVNDTVDKVQEASLARTLRVAVALAQRLTADPPSR
jgi:hypothetical protein